MQRQVYDIVYASQQAGIEFIRPGVSFKDVHRTCMRVLAEGLADLGLLPVSVDEAMEETSTVYRRWTLHGFGHMLGIDVHDCSNARKETYRNGTLGEGYVLTVEPGLYFQPEDELVPAELRGIGIRIEDDVLVHPGRRGQPLGRPAPARGRGGDLAGRPARGRTPPARLTGCRHPMIFHGGEPRRYDDAAFMPDPPWEASCPAGVSASRRARRPWTCCD